MQAQNDNEDFAQQQRHQSAIHPDDEVQDNDFSRNKWKKNGYGLPVGNQSGKFTEEETLIVKNAIRDYCKTKKISVARLCSECEHKSELKGAWLEIAKRVPNRSVQSVYRHGIRQCHPFKRGTWNKHEQNQLVELVSKMGKKWSCIQLQLNRSADSCRDKYREICEDYIKGRWREKETALLVQHICEFLLQNPIPSSSVKSVAQVVLDDYKSNPKFNNNENSKTNSSSKVTTTITAMNLVMQKSTCKNTIQLLGQLVDAEPEIQIPWSTVSKKMGHRSRLSCFKKWQKMISSQATAPSNVSNANVACDTNTSFIRNVDHKSNEDNNPKSHSTTNNSMTISALIEATIDMNDDEQLATQVIDAALGNTILLPSTIPTTNNKQTHHMIQLNEQDRDQNNQRDQIHINEQNYGDQPYHQYYDSNHVASEYGDNIEDLAEMAAEMVEAVNLPDTKKLKV